VEANKADEAGVKRGIRCRLSVATAAVSGALGAIVCALLAYNYFALHATAPLESPTLDALKGALTQPAEASAGETVARAYSGPLSLLTSRDPRFPACGLWQQFALLEQAYAESVREEAARKERIRQEKVRAEARDVDLRLRRDYFRGMALADRGRYLLLGCLVVFGVSIAVAAACRKELPMPGKSAAQVQPRGRMHALARWSVAGVGAAMFAAAAILLATTASDVRRGSPAAGQGLPSNGPGAPQIASINPTATSYPSAEEVKRNWPRFRGPGGLGISAYENVPDSWDGTTGEGILWRNDEKLLPGENSPVVWGKRLFMTGADKRRREVYCFDADTGKLLWRKPVRTAEGAGRPPPSVLEDTGHAASTAVTDGQRVFAIFANWDLACLDFDGKEVWCQNVGPIPHPYGYGTSLSMWRNLLIVSRDQGLIAELGKSNLLALDAATGRKAWQAPRPETPGSWATPIVIDTGKGEQIITCSNPWIIAYEPSKGTEIWRVKCFGGDVAPSPVFGGGLVFAAMEGYKLVAIRPDGTGDVTKTHVAWFSEENLPEMVSPLTDGNYVWTVTSPGTLTCYNARNGKKLYEQDLEKSLKSSPGLAGGKLYVVNEEGLTIIAKAGPEYEELGRCPLGEHCSSSPVFQDGRIYLRGKKSLFCIGKK